MNTPLPTLHVLLGATLLAMSAPAALAGDIAGAGQLDCSIFSGTSETRWKVELDEAVPIAQVDEQDRPAEYSIAHVQIRLSIDGPMLTIGRTTGRAVASDNNGVTLGMGSCQPQVYVSTSAPRRA